MAKVESCYENCLKGTLHPTPESGFLGKQEKIAGIETYYTIPSGTYDKTKALIFIGDIFGFYNNTKLVVDNFASHGYATYFPDFFNGEPVPFDGLADPNFDFPAWLARHDAKVVRAAIDPVIAELKKQGVTRFAATGYCFGARYVWDLAIENVTSVSIVSHPSFIVAEKDVPIYIAKSTAPVLINACETDSMWPIESQKTAAKLFEGFAPGFKQDYYAGVSHGFAVRSNPDDPVAWKAMNDAFKESVAFLDKYL